MKKLLVLISLALLLGLVLIGCPQPTDSGNGGGTSEPVFKDLTGTGVGTMKAIPGGEFVRGDTDITVSNFYLGETEVTQAQWAAVMTDNPNPSYFSTDENLPAENYPVERISWYDAIEFCNALTRAELTEADVVYTITKTDETDQRTWAVGLDVTKKGYRLPTEAEWEYAAGGGESSARTIYAAPITVDSAVDGIDDIDGTKKLIDYAWYSENAKGTTHIVGTAGSKESPLTAKSGKANDLGLFDMSGNVWEWCWDRHVNPYDTSVTDNPTGATSGSSRVIRGGSWSIIASYCRVADRTYYSPSNRYYSVGLRVARSY